MYSKNCIYNIFYRHREEVDRLQNDLVKAKRRLDEKVSQHVIFILMHTLIRV